MGKNVYIDTEECIGCENCVTLCPDVFGFDGATDKAFVITAEGGSKQCIDEAIDTCPAGCIHWE